MPCTVVIIEPTDDLDFSLKDASPMRTELKRHVLSALYSFNQERYHRVARNYWCRPHSIKPFQDTDSDTVRLSIKKLSRRVLTISVATDQSTDQIQFTVPKEFKIEGNCLAAALACLCGTTFQSIYLDFPTSPEARELIAKGCNAKVTSKSDCKPRTPGTGNCLAFSGGMDSLACKYIAPNRNYDLIGIDFGGWFEREYQFLRDYDDIKYICSTDFRRKRYDRNSWLFMASPILLLADHFGWKSVAFGSTLESSPFTLFEMANCPVSHHWLTACGMKNESTLQGCSEFLGSRIVLQNEPDIVDKSLTSVAATGSEKSFRKALALHLVKSIMNNRPTNRFDIAMPEKRVTLGKEQYVDFAFLLFAKYCDPDWLLQAVDIPDDILASVKNTDCDWMLKYHPIGLQLVSGQAKADLLDGLKENQIEIFSEKDLSDFRAFTKIMKRIKKSPATGVMG